LALKQVAWTNRAFWRNPAAAAFTVAFPLMFLVVLTLLFGQGEVTVVGVRISSGLFFVPSIAAFGVITACYTNIAMSVTIQRDAGLLKRLRGTPMPPGAWLGGRVIHATSVGVFLVALCVAYGAAFEGLEVTASILPGLALTVLVGSAAFAAMGLAVTAAIPTADAASAVVNATILPLFFISNVFVPLHDPPAWIDAIGAFFPVRAFADSMQSAVLGQGVAWSDLGWVFAWGVLGLAVAVRWFRWEPRT
jgi:ABC-2 type transport system permease protein